MQQKQTVSDFHILVGKRDALEAQLKQTETALAKVNEEMDRLAEELSEQALAEDNLEDVGDESYPVDDEELALM